MASEFCVRSREAHARESRHPRSHASFCTRSPSDRLLCGTRMHCTVRNLSTAPKLQKFSYACSVFNLSLKIKLFYLSYRKRLASERLLKLQISLPMSKNSNASKKKFSQIRDGAPRKFRSYRSLNKGDQN